MDSKELMNLLESKVYYISNYTFDIDTATDEDTNGDSVYVTLDFDSSSLDEDSYLAMEKLLEDFSDEHYDKALALYDVSGYHYWNEIMKEPNTIMVEVIADKINSDKEASKVAGAIDLLYDDLYELLPEE